MPFSLYLIIIIIISKMCSSVLGHADHGLYIAICLIKISVVIDFLPKSVMENN